MKILLVDDEEELVATLAERLSFRDIEADWVASAEEALKIAACNTYDLAVLDVRLPKMSGIVLQQKLEEKCPDMKYIFLTGHGSEEDFKAGAAEAGHEYYLVKPVNIDILIEKMKEVLGIK